MPDFDVFSLLEICKRTARSHGSRVQKLANCTLRDLAAKLLFMADFVCFLI